MFFCGRVDKRFDYLAGDRKLARHACESLYFQVECAGIERLENSFSSCCCCDKVGREELAKQRFLNFFWTTNKVVWGRTGVDDDFLTVSFQKKLPLLDSVVF